MKAISPSPGLLLAPERAAHADGFRRIGGIDEAGRGPWAGPVVAAAVILRSRPQGVRIDDSKRLTARQRERAYAVILRCADVGIGLASPEEIDHLNILQATLMAMRRAILDLPAPPDVLLIDGTIAPAVPIPCRPIAHGDRLSEVIGCASIVAKVVRDRLMHFYHDLLPQYAFDQHKGYGTPLHTERLRQFGPSLLHRLTFEPVRRSAAPGMEPADVLAHEPVALARA
ncbi:MAG: ribonuclease HII [Candidatus Omnitrophica bacterium]|nr:ribonuclease HII [Candidatus Omnitrophota bacterium]